MNEKQKFFLKKAERLRLKRGFEYLFEHGSSFRVGVLKFFYVFNVPDTLAPTPLSVGFSAPKRAFKQAVIRNLLKRRMREAYRLNKHTLLTDLEQKDNNLLLLIKYNTRYISNYHRIAHATVLGLQKLQQQLDKLETDIHHND